MPAIRGTTGIYKLLAEWAIPTILPKKQRNLKFITKKTKANSNIGYRQHLCVISTKNGFKQNY